MVNSKNLSLIKKRDFKNLINSFFKKKSEIEHSFYKNNNGLKTCLDLSKITDVLIQKIYKKILIKNNLTENDLIITAVGGYGRKHLAPFSDLDIMFVPFSKKKEIKDSIEAILYLFWDCGFRVGHSVRKLDELIGEAQSDLSTQTSVIDMRKICGSETKFKLLETRLNFFFKEYPIKKFYDLKITERLAIIKQENNSLYFLEPNIKEGAGGLRDLNILFWFLKRFFGTDDLHLLEKENKIFNSEKKKILKSLNFLMTVRCYMHFINKGEKEKLTFHLQQIISEKMRYKNRKLNLQVERFMKHLYLQTRNIQFLCKHLPKSLLFPSEKNLENIKKLNDDIILSGNFIRIKDENIFLKKSENLINIFFESVKLKIPIHPSAFRFFFDKMTSFDQILIKDISTRLKFETIIFQNVFEDTMDVLNECGVISKLIPDFSKINFKTQFDLHHAYTVDQHTINALNLLRKINSDNIKIKFLAHPSIVFKKVRHPRRLFLSVLFHDIGKGFEKSHQEKGADIARKVLPKLGYSRKDIGEICWLVQNHLIFSEFAFKKDLEEKSEIKSFTRKIQSLEKLQLLYLLTVVDVASVNPKSWNSWKGSLLERLYQKCLEEIQKPLFLRIEIFDEKIKKKIKRIQKKVFFNLEKNTEKDFNNFCNITISEFWTSQPIEKIAHQIDFFFLGSELLKEDNVLIENSKVKGILEVSVVTKNRRKLLLDIIETFIIFEMNVLEARIFTFKNDLVIDTFKITPSSKLKLNENDLEEKKKNLSKYMNENLKKQKKLKNLFAAEELVNRSIKDSKSVDIDIASSEIYYIIKVTSNDRQFLLYDILQIILKEKLSISVAKISTTLDYIEDIFYIKKKENKKVSKNNNLSKLKESLLRII